MSRPGMALHGSEQFGDTAASSGDLNQLASDHTALQLLYESRDDQCDMRRFDAPRLCMPNPLLRAGWQPSWNRRGIFNACHRPTPSHLMSFSPHRSQVGRRLVDIESQLTSRHASTVASISLSSHPEESADIENTSVDGPTSSARSQHLL